MKKDKTRAPSLSNPDGNGSMPKKQKLVDRNQNPLNQKAVAKHELNISEKEIGHLQGREKTVVKESKSKKDEKHTKSVAEKWKHHIPPNAAKEKTEEKGTAGKERSVSSLASLFRRPL
ncbi:hypothetical protein V6N13_044888 [Hibiscus sabdariffa]|uniref:Uncharacterized protein n=1 Tax=Hibiscus sabdariffa TaxID=183260 RepID=A0ABR2RJW6_9ROSI